MSKSVDIEKLIFEYGNYSKYSEGFLQPEFRQAKLQEVAIAIADYMFRCQEFDPSIIKMVKDRSSGPV